MIYRRFIMPSLAMVALSLPASAQLIAYESFTGMSLGGVTGTGGNSFGWASAWQGTGLNNSHVQIVDPVPDLTYQVTEGGTMKGGNRALQLATAPEPITGTVVLTRDLPTIGGTFYISFLVRVSAIGTGTDTVEFRLMKGTTVLKSYQIQPSIDYSFFASAGSSIGTLRDDGTPSLIALRIENVSPPASYAFLSGVNPAYGTTLSGSSSILTGPINRLGIAVISSDGSGPTTTVLLDEIRVGYSLNDVLVAQPAFALGGAPAARLRWPTQSGKNYQPQFSYDLAKWYNLGSSVSGTGQTVEVLDEGTPDAPRSYRVIEK